jgi:hypothetical protein
MIRCRECGQSAKEEQGDFELTGHVLMPSQDSKCPRCGSTLDPAVTECPTCASQMLDELMSGPEPSAVPSPHMTAERPMSIMEQRVRQAAAHSAVSEHETPAEFDTIADTSPTRVRPGPKVPAKAKGASVTQPAMNPARSSAAPPKGPAPVRSEKPAVADTPAPKSVMPAPEDEEAPAAVETSPACAALLHSLASADASLRCEIAAALGKLGDQAALEPLERHMGDKDIRVRRAVAAALVQLGHPKGETLLGIAERMPASSVLMLAKPPAKVKRKSGGGTNIDPRTLIKVGGGLLAAALLGGGIWMWMNSSPSPRGKGKKGKSAATAKASAAKTKAKAKPAADD